MLSGKQVAIVGGGPGGLTLARLLQGQGVAVKVFERDAGPQVRVQGATLDLHHESGLKALEAAGLLDAFKAHYRPGADRMRITDRHARILYDEGEDKMPAAFGDVAFRPEIDRGPLRDLLLNGLEAGTVVWGHQVLSMLPQEGGWLISFHNGSSLYADVVIGADGANSKIRPYLTSIRPFYAGITIVEGTLYEAAVHAPAMEALAAGGKVFALGGEQSLIVSAKGDGSLAFYTGCKVPEFWAEAAGIDPSRPVTVLSWFRDAFNGWAPVWQELFDNDQVHFVVRPQYCMPPDQAWDARSNITLLGDAAHLMPPYAGEGVNMAMLDALELCEALCGGVFAGLRAAIGHYEKNMRVRAGAKAQMTLDQTAALHAPDGLDYLLRMMGGEVA